MNLIKKIWKLIPQSRATRKREAIALKNNFSCLAYFYKMGFEDGFEFKKDKRKYYIPYK